MKRYWKMDLSHADGSPLVLVVATSHGAVETDLGAHPEASLIRVATQDEPRETGTKFFDCWKENPDFAHRALARGAFMHCLQAMKRPCDSVPAFTELTGVEPQTRPTSWIGVMQIVPVWENPRMKS